MFARLQSEPMLLVAGLILAAVQFAAALPWLWAIDPKGFERATRSGSSLGYVVGGLVVAGVLVAMFIAYQGDSANLQRYGQYVYGAALHLQLLIDLLLVMPGLLVAIWPKGGAVAQAAYREGWRQPMFWLIIVGAIAGAHIV